MQYHQEHPQAAWAAYVGLGRSDPVLLGIDDEAKNRQMEHIMSRIGEVDGIRARCSSPTSSATCGSIIHGWLAFTFEMCRQRIIDPDDQRRPRSADACAHALLDAIARVPDSRPTGPGDGPTSAQVLQA